MDETDERTRSDRSAGADRRRRAVLAAVVAAGVGSLSLSGARGLLETFAPLSGRAWDAAGREPAGEVDSPYGDATVRYDGLGVPHVEADGEAAAAFAVGYVQGFDRLFQLDLGRRLVAGRLSELAGEATVEDDEFHRRMGFRDAAEASWEPLADAPVGGLLEAYADGVNAAIDDEPLPLEFELLDYEPEPWTPVDTLSAETQIGWALTGEFGELRRALVADRLGEEFLALYPDRMDHDAPILRGTATDGDTAGVAAADRPGEPVGAALTDWLSAFESPRGTGSNSWVVSGEHTESGRPIVANDPHLELTVPPLWYEQHVRTPEADVRGVTFPGVPFVIIGANADGTWGFTNVGADVLDCYRYEIDADDPNRYRYRGEWREFDRERQSIAVADGEDRTITVRRSVHGPVLEREGRTVGVAWTGLAATRTTEAIYGISRSGGLEDVREAARRFDLPTQNLVYADADGRTLYQLVGKLPIRRIDGEAVPGDRIFDGSAGEGEWDGFTPYGESSWEGFVPFEELPAAVDPDHVATANQRVADDPDHYIGVAYATPYRGRRLYDVLDGAAPTEPADHRALQTDLRDERAVELVPALLSALEDVDWDGIERVDETGDDGTAGDSEGGGDPGDADDPGGDGSAGGPGAVDAAAIADAADVLADWEYRMDRDSRGALVFARWFEAFRERVFEPSFGELGESYYPNDWVLATLPDGSPPLDGRSRETVMVEALATAVAEIDEAGWERYGDVNTTAPIDHPFGGEAPFLGYADRPADGSRATVKNYRASSAVGASWRMVAEAGGDAWAILPGGNSGDYFSAHYGDQFQAWVDGEYRPMALEPDGEVSITFGGDRS